MQTDPDAALLDQDSTLERLQSSLSTIERAVKLIPPDWTHRSPAARSRRSRARGARR